MPSKLLSASYVLDSSGISAGVNKADSELGRLGGSADKMGDDFDKSTSKIGSMFESLGSSLGSFGIPFSASVTKMGTKLDEAKSKGQGFKQAMSDLGGATLAVGAVGIAAVGVEAVKMADNFDVAQSQLQVAVKNSGESFKAMQPSIDATYGSMAKLGFNSTDVAGSLTALVTSTGNTKKAEGDLAIAADLARAKHISLSDATGILTKTLAGSTRGLTALGLNLDVGSGKLKTIASDTTAYQTAEGKLHLVNQQVADGTLKGAAAYSALLTAHQAVDKSSQKLQLDQGTIAKILDTVKDKTKGAADAFGNTLTGQEAIAGAEAHNLGTKFGQDLTPMIVGAEHAVMDSVLWLEKHKTVAEALGITIGTFLAGAVAVFTVNMVSGMIASTTSALTSLGLLSGGADAAATSTGNLTAATELQSGATDTAAINADTLAGSFDDVGTSATTAAGELGTFDGAISTASGEATTAAVNADTLGGSFDDVGTSATTAAGELEGFDGALTTAGGEALTTAGNMDTLGTSATGATTKMSLAGDAAGEEGMAGGMVDAEGAAGGLTAGLGPLAIAAGAVVVGGTLLNKVWPAPSLINATAMSFANTDTTLKKMAATTLPEMTLKMGDLKTAQDKAAASMNAGGQTGQFAKAAYEQLGSQIDTLKAQHTQLTSNEQILATNFGITKNQALQVAQALGINLTQALNPTQVTAFGQQIQQMGLNATGTGSAISGMSANAVTALTALASQLQSTGTAANWGQLGQMIDFGIGNGITQNAGFVVNAAQGMVQSVIAGARTGLKASSPSLVARDMIGATIPAGVAQGILAGIPLVNAAADKMTKGALGAGAPSVIGASSIAGASGPGAGAGVATAAPTQLTVQVSVQGHVLDGRQLSDLVYQGLVEKGLVNGSGGQLFFKS